MRFKKEKKVYPILTKSEFSKMLNAAKNDRDKLILLVFIDSGVRRSELIILKISDIDF